MTIKIMVNGAQGKMGQEVVKTFECHSDFELVGQLSRHHDLSAEIAKQNPDVVIDFTSPEVVYQNALTILESGARPVIGTTGLSKEQVQYLSDIAEKQKLGAIIAPNFSISAILLMKFAQMAAPYFSHVEIIELHHGMKKDAPSGTALKTAEMIAKHRREIPADPTEKLLVEGARGGFYQDIPIHSVRMPGFMAHERVIFGLPGETLTLSQDSLHRACFMPGVVLACRKVMDLSSLVYGLESLL